MQPWRKSSASNPNYNGLSPHRQLLLKVEFAALSSKMNRIILQLFAVGFCFAVGQALQCYKCKIGVWDLCFTSKTTCNSGEHCFSGVGKAAAGIVDIKTKGCLKEADCNKTTEVNYPADSNTTVYKLTKTCCNTDLCNAAPGLPGTSGLSLALATITALFAANFLV